MDAEQKRIRFRELNIESLSDLYHAMRNLPWVGSFKMPKFESFLKCVSKMVHPSRVSTTILPEEDWLDVEANTHVNDDNSEKKMLW